MPFSRLGAALLCTVFLGCAAAPALAAEAPAEPFFPRAGNRGYDVGYYHASLSYRPGSGLLRASASANSVATQRLSRFSLDLFGMRVTEVLVNREPAEFSRGRGKLKVVPLQPIRRGQRFSVLVFYRGKPRTITDPDGSQEGWYPTDDGALAVGEPLGTAAWMPCNDIPGDKAKLEIDVTVPNPLKGVANGRLVGVQKLEGKTRYEWRQGKPMSPYLAVVDIGRGRIERGTIAGIPAWTLVDPRLARRSHKPLAALPEVVRFESRLFGPYPFSAAGSIVDLAPKLGYALETQTRPIYPYVPDLTTVVHETAHQWFGDSVGLKRWPNIWLNEGFATWTEWYYAERHGGRSAHAIFDRLRRVPASDTAFWEPPSGHPGTPKNLFATSTYVRGAMALEALRLKIGTGLMLQVLHSWAEGHRYGSADIKEFIALAEEISGRNLQPLFGRWLYKRGKP